MRRRNLLAVGASLGTVGVVGCLGGDEEVAAVEPDIAVEDDGFAIDRAGDETVLPVHGVNLGLGLPGHFPGETAIGRERYARWFDRMAELNVNAVRVYTIHPPAFYEALAAHNDGSDAPIHLIHGAWLDVAALTGADDAFARSEPFQRELRRVVDVVNGDAVLRDRPGRASGHYLADVARYTLGYVVGIEWPPQVVMSTNERHEVDSFDGDFLRVTDAPPFERWLCIALDGMVDHEVATYGRQRPVAFMNWVTTDVLEHPYEPFDLEDAVAVDPDLLDPTSRFTAGTFAAYHAYPYYPDFLNETPDYIDHVDHRGEPNSYAGYLSDLVDATTAPLLVAEFGLPSSRGIAHRHVHGRHQGDLTETERNHHVAAMYEDIRAAGAIGGLAFAWQDEWFKRTWNGLDFVDANREPYWLNVQSPEQHFGLVAFEPSAGIRLNGAAEPWTGSRTVHSAERPRTLEDGHDGHRRIDAVRITSDEAYLYLRIELGAVTDPMPWDRVHLLAALSLTGRGNERLPFGVDADVSGADFVARIGGPDASALYVDAYYDAFAARYGEEAGLDLSAYREPRSGRFTPIRQVINRGYTVPPTGEEVPFKAVEAGALRFGTADPTDPGFDSLTDVHVATGANAVELRLPWQLLNVADPSQRRRLGDVWAEGLDRYRSFETIDIGVASYRPDASGDARPHEGPSNLHHGAPSIEGGTLALAGYEPPTWDDVSADERLKAGVEAIAEAFEEG